MKKFQKYELKRGTTVIDKYGQMGKPQLSTIAELPIAVFLKSDSPYNNNPLFSEITYVGIYKGSFTDFQKHDRLDNKYIINQIVSGNRKVLLYLTEV